MNPSHRIDELAHLVLSSANWPIDPSKTHHDQQSSLTPHLDELERALDIRLEPLSTVLDGGECSMRTCTLPNGETSAPDEGAWTWAPHLDDIENSYKATNQFDPRGTDSTLVEEMAPFPPEYYRRLGDLAREVFHPSIKNLGDESVIAPMHAAAEGRHALRSLDRYSLPRMHDAVCLTRILLALQEMHVAPPQCDVTFLDRLLYYCEGNARQHHGNT